MRCLTLANALAERGIESVFACRSLPEALAERLRANGHSIIHLKGASVETDLLPVEAVWPPDVQAEDAFDCLAGAGRKIDWVVVDHYGLDHSWQGAIRRGLSRLMVIDDLANRKHDCDLLLDQNLGRRGLDYDDLVSPSTRVLAGLKYALLRPEFAQLRARSLTRRRSPLLKRILVSIGGADPQNLTARILECLDAIDLPSDTEITAVVGGLSPFKDQVVGVAEAMRSPTRVLFDVGNMADLMVESDLAIGGGGATAWERCCLGLPSVVLVLGENQRAGADALSSAGGAIAISVGSSEGLEGQLRSAIKTIASKGLDVFAKKVIDLDVDGLGARRAAEHLMAVTVRGEGGRLRKVDSQDMELLLRWRNSALIRSVMFTQDLITPEVHQRWFENAVGDDDRRLLIFELGGKPMGFINLKIEPHSGRASWGFYKGPDAPRGAGRQMCKMALSYAFERLGVDSVEAEVLTHNDASNRLHRALGFVTRVPEGEAHSRAVCYELQKCDWTESVVRQAESE